MTTGKEIAIRQEYAIFQVGDDFQEVVRENLGQAGRGVGTFVLDRAKVPSGGATVWSVPTMDGEDAVKEIRGILIYQRPNRAYYKTPFNEKQGNQPPDCRSSDLMFGIGDPGGACNDCPFNQYDTETGTKLCKESRVLFILRPGEIMPLVVVAPTMSVKSTTQYLLRLTSRGIPYYGVEIRLGLVKARSRGNIDYAQISFAMGARLTNEELAAIKQARNMLLPALEAFEPEQEESVAAE